MIFIFLIPHIQFIVFNPNSPLPLQHGRWSKEFVDFVSKCLVRDPGNRPSAKELIKHPFVIDAAIELALNHGRSNVLNKVVRDFYWNEEITICDGLNFSQFQGIEELKIDENSFNESCGDISKMKMDLSEFKKLKLIEIGNQCFQHVREFVIDGLESLDSVKIGEKCFRIDRWKKRDDGVCRITNCPNLRQLEIGDRSFEDFKSFELSNLNSLQSIDIGWCFKYADFSLKGE